MNKKRDVRKEIKVKFEEMSFSQRSFLKGSLKALSGLAVLELGAAGVLFLRANSLDGEYGGIMTVGSVDDSIPGSVVEYEEGNFYLVRQQDGGFMAIHRRCPHLGCTVKYVEKEEKFYCPCHSAAFDQNGEFENQIVAPALDVFPVLFENGMVKVDTSQPQIRDHYSAKDVSHYT